MQLTQYLLLSRPGRWVRNDVERPVFNALLGVFGVEAHGGPGAQLELGDMRALPHPQWSHLLLIRPCNVVRLDLNLVCLDGCRTSTGGLLGI